MSDPYVIFPGTSGNYIDTADVNLLDADSAHCVQSQPYSSGFGSVSQLPADGDGLQGVRLSATSSGNIRVDVANALTVVASTQYSCVFTFTNGGTTQVTLSPALLCGGGDLVFPSLVVAAGATVTYSDVATIPASPTDLTPSLWLRMSSGGEIGADYDFRRIMVAQGTVATFVPSLRIVGDLDMAADVAVDNWTLGTRQTFLANGYTAGFGYRLIINSNDSIGFNGYGAVGLINEQTALYTFVDGERTVIRLTLDVTSGDLTYYQDGAVVDTDTFTAQALIPGAAALNVGALSSAVELIAGDYYSAVVKDGIDGPVVARFDAQDAIEAI